MSNGDPVTSWADKKGTEMFQKRGVKIAGVAAAVILAISLASVPAVAASTRSTKSTGASGVTTAGISSKECKANRAAGVINFETSFSYAAAASILDVIVADKRGYFKDMCLTVKLSSGFSTTNVADVSSNHIQISSLGSNSEVIAANLEKANVVGIATLGNTAVSELLTPAWADITNLKQLDGKPVGIKGAFPYEVAAMLSKEGVNISSIQQIQEGFDPTIINNHSIYALPVYKSNEVYELNAVGIKYTAWNPTNYGIAASFASFIANRSWASRHPTAVTDFMRADLHGFAWAIKHVTQAVTYSQSLLPSYLGISYKLSLFRWRTESAICLHSAPKGVPFGQVDLSAAKTEYAQDVKLGLLKPGSNLKTDFNNSYVDAAYSGTTLVWPTKFH
jgi:ABC-type nitrate/sulfonate/bicarbonate transport system substrate-binding protein